LAVDELDIGALREGQTAVITLDSFPDTPVNGTVRQIAPNATNTAGSDLVTYEVRLALAEEDTAVLPIRLGMTANAQLLTAEKEEVLLVPNRAIRADRQQGRFFVTRVLSQDPLTTEEVEVTLGLRDNQNTEIISGISAGDNLLIGSAIPTVNFGPGGGNE
jgi:HlyD family secretion protein